MGDRMSGYRQIRADEVSWLLRLLIERIESKGASADLYIVGGVAMTLQLGRPEMTPDIDTLLNPRAEVLTAASELAAELGFDPDWVNSRAFAFATFDSEADIEALVLDFPGHRVRVASPRFLLVMKFAASRAKDRDDVTALIQFTGVRTAEELVEITIDVLGEDSVAFSAPHDRVRETLLLEAEDAFRTAAARPVSWVRPQLP